MKHEKECKKRLVPCLDGCCLKTVPFDTLLKHLEEEERPIIGFNDSVFSAILQVSDEDLECEFLTWIASIRGSGQLVCRRRELVQCSRNWSVRSDFKRTVKFCLYSRRKHSPWLLTP
jgi:hypothetical protein